MEIIIYNMSPVTARPKSHTSNTCTDIPPGGQKFLEAICKGWVGRNQSQHAVAPHIIFAIIAVCPPLPRLIPSPANNYLVRYERLDLGRGAKGWVQGAGVKAATL